MLVAARGRKAPIRLIATGKTYRIESEDTSTKLQAFHQAEALWIEEGLTEWRMMDLFADFIEGLAADARLKIEQRDFALQCDRGWGVSAQWPGQEWSSISGWGRIKAEAVGRLGL